MTLADEITQALKTNKAILGYRESIKFLKTDSAQKVVIAKNAPENIRKEMEHNSKVAKTEVEIFEGSSKELGVVCGKPFPVTVLVIK